MDFELGGMMNMSLGDMSSALNFIKRNKKDLVIANSVQVLNELVEESNKEFEAEAREERENLGLDSDELEQESERENDNDEIDTSELLEDDSEEPDEESSEADEDVEGLLDDDESPEKEESDLEGMLDSDENDEQPDREAENLLDDDDEQPKVEPEPARKRILDSNIRNNDSSSYNVSSSNKPDTRASLRERQIEAEIRLKKERAKAELEERQRLKAAERAQARKFDAQVNSSHFKKEQPKQEIKTANTQSKLDYGMLNLSDLYKIVEKFMIDSGVRQKPIDVGLIEEKFGSQNIRKLLNKGYLLKMGRRVTIGYVR